MPSFLGNKIQRIVEEKRTSRGFTAPISNSLIISWSLQTNKILEAFITSTTPSREEFPTHRVALKLANREHTHQASLKCVFLVAFFFTQQKKDPRDPNT